MASRKERIWIEEYLRCWNATEAARRADYKWPRRIGSRKLAKFETEIQERIDELVMSADETLVRLSEIARGTWGEYICPDGSVDVTRMVGDGKAYLLRKISDSRYGRRIEFCDMQAALEKIGRAHGLFVERREISGPDRGPIPIREEVIEIIIERPSDEPVAD